MTHPNTFIIGAPKCGTTALAHYLSEHPNVFFCKPKEPFFYCTDFPHLRDRLNLTNIQQYLQLFEAAEPHRHACIAEGSTNYLRSKTAIENILDAQPDARFIAMLRDPVETSQALHMEQIFSGNEVELDFEKAWRIQDARKNGENIPANAFAPEFLQYAYFSSYADQIERLFDLVPEDQRLVILHDELKANTRAVYLQLLDFLRLPDDNRTDFPIINASHVHRSKIIAKFVQNPPRAFQGPVLSLRRYLRRKQFPFVEYLKTIMRKSNQRHPITSQFRIELSRFFQPDIQKLKKLIRNDLSRWQSCQ